MAARDRDHVGAAAVDGEMHRHFERRSALARHLAPVEIELDQLGLGDEPERAARRDQHALGADARTHMAEAFDDPEEGEHATSRKHFGAQFRRRCERHMPKLSD